MSDLDLAPGIVAWATLEPVRGREQGGHRPMLVIASIGYLDAVTTLVIVLSISTVDRVGQTTLPLTVQAASIGRRGS